MARVFLNNNAINQKGTPLLYTDILSNRPQYGINGRLFFSTDSQQIFEDTGTSWLLLADATGSVSGYVPYVGATTNLDLGLFNITASSFISGNFTTGSVLFIGSSNNINQDNSNFFWDDTNNRLGIGTNIPGTYIDVHGTSNVLMQLNNIDVSGNLNTTIAFQNQNIANWIIGNYPNGGQQIFKIYDVLNSRDSLTIIGTQINTLLDFTAAKITGNYIVKSGGTSSQILAADGSVITAGTNIIISGGTISSSGGTTTNALTLNNSGTGAASGTTFNGSAAITLSYNTIGAQQALTLTTTGTSGAATLISGTLNIPNYAPDLTPYVTLATTQTLIGFKTFNPSVTASGAIARGGYYTPALTAAANNDVLVGLDINPTFTNGAFTGVSNYGFRSLTGINLINQNYNGSTGLTITNTTSGTGAQSYLQLNSTTGYISLGKLSPTSTQITNTIVADDAYILNNITGNLSIHAQTGNLKFTSRGGTSVGMSLVSNQNLLIASTTDQGAALKLQITGSEIITAVTATGALTVNNTVTTMPTTGSLTTINSLTVTDTGNSLAGGAVVLATENVNFYKSSGSRTIPNSVNLVSELNILQPQISGSSTITQQQASSGGTYNGIRALSATSTMFYMPSTAASTSTITHAAGLRSFLYSDNTANTYTITNYYGILINATTEAAPSNITNRYGIYQDGTSDVNLLNGELQLGAGQTVSASVLSTVTNKIKLIVNGTTYYLLASTSNA